MHERHEMAICEAHQRAIDRFWGIPTAKEKERRLAEFLRRQVRARESCCARNPYSKKY